MSNKTIIIDGDFTPPESQKRLVEPISSALNDLVSLTEQYAADSTPKNLDKISQYWNKLGKDIQCNNRILQFAELSPQMRVITRNLTFSYSIYEKNQYGNSVYNYQQLMFNVCTFFRQYCQHARRTSIVFAGQGKDGSTLLALSLDGRECMVIRLSGFINTDKEYVSRRLSGKLEVREPKYNDLSKEFATKADVRKGEATVDGFIFKGQFIQQYMPVHRIGLSKTFNFCDGIDLLYYPSKEAGSNIEDE
ncbi:MAG: hypothetical protein II623_06025 [Paludibacteraceae bacterium]|nr:hypothetical protein [Paludibacteraceae bacterium]MBR6041831.1 hypothetical protein [Paludibacteraceae bacterium]